MFAQIETAAATAAAIAQNMPAGGNSATQYILIVAVCALALVIAGLWLRLEKTQSAMLAKIEASNAATVAKLEENNKATAVKLEECDKDRRELWKRLSEIDRRGGLATVH